MVLLIFNIFKVSKLFVLSSSKPVTARCTRSVTLWVVCVSYFSNSNRHPTENILVCYQLLWRTSMWSLALKLKRVFCSTGWKSSRTLCFAICFAWQKLSLLSFIARCELPATLLPPPFSQSALLFLPPTVHLSLPSPSPPLSATFASDFALLFVFHTPFPSPSFSVRSHRDEGRWAPVTVLLIKT